MNPFVKHTGLVVPLDRTNVDTDAIIPKQFLKRIERTGFGQFLFFDWRYLAGGSPNPNFILNEKRYQGASILVAGKNFGSGSSREHAPWALADYGFRVLIAPSYADIFFTNCYQNGLLPIVLPEEQVVELQKRAATLAGYQVTVDLEGCKLSDSHGFGATFQVDPFRRHCLLNGLDEIGLSLHHADKITAFEAKRPAYRSSVSPA